MTPQAGLFTFPWDFADEGVDEVVAVACDLGVTHLIVASVYHAGFFLYPHNPRRKTHLLEDGVAYFHPDLSRYGRGPMRPRVAAMCRDRDWFAVICEKAVASGLKVCAWTVFCHNTPLGLAHPEATIHNAFGQSYPHALSPGHPATIAYCRALTDDLASRYPLDMILVEAANFRGRKHGSDWVAGHHHERDGVYLRPLEMSLMNVSFNLADVHRARDQGIDTDALRQAVRLHLQHYLDEAPDPPTNLPETLRQFEEHHPALIAYQSVMRCAEQDLASAMRDAAHAHGVRLMGTGSPAYDVSMTGVYGQPIAQVQRLITEARAQRAPHQQSAVLLRMGFNSPGYGTPIVSQEQMTAVTRAAHHAGADFVGYYNYAEAPRRCVQWIKAALAELDPMRIARK